MTSPTKSKCQASAQPFLVYTYLELLLLGLQLAVIMQGWEESYKMHVYLATSFSRRIKYPKDPGAYMARIYDSRGVDGCIVWTPELDSLIPGARRYSLGF